MIRGPLEVLQEAARGHDHAPLFKAEIREAIARIETLVLQARRMMVYNNAPYVPNTTFAMLGDSLAPFTPGHDSEGGGNA